MLCPALQSRPLFVGEVVPLIDPWTPPKVPQMWLRSFSTVGSATPSWPCGCRGSSDIVERPRRDWLAAVQALIAASSEVLALEKPLIEVEPVVVKTKSLPSMRGRPARMLAPTARSGPDADRCS